MITTRQFEGWCKKAYPNVRLEELLDGSRVASTKDKFKNYRVLSIDLHYFEEDNKFIFEGLDRRPTIFPIDESSDSLLISYCRRMWGEPKVAFVPAVEQKEEDPAPTPSPIPSQPKKEDTKKEDEGRKQIIAKLSNTFKEKIAFNKLFNGSLEIIVGENSGPILYDYGISPDKQSTHIFIPYSKKEQVSSLINNFINKIKSN